MTAKKIFDYFFLLVAALGVLLSAYSIKADEGLCSASASTTDPCSLPPPTEWRHRPIFLQADPNSTALVYDYDSSHDGLPLDQPIAFESDIFQGTIVIRLASLKGNHTHPHGHHPSWQWQYTLQGRFRKAIPMDQLYMGEIYDRPLVGLPAPFIVKAVQKLFAIIAPGLQFEVDLPTQPKVMVLLGGNIHAMRVDQPGQEPDIVECSKNDMAEASSTLSASFVSAAERKAQLRRPTEAALYEFDSHHVYTFQHQDAVMDYINYKAHLAPGINVDLIPHLNGQAMSLGAMTLDGRWLFRFRLWNERTVQEVKKNDPRFGCDEE
jgi:Protein of unknown function (DUF1769)